MVGPFQGGCIVVNCFAIIKIEAKTPDLYDERKMSFKSGPGGHA